MRKQKRQVPLERNYYRSYANRNNCTNRHIDRHRNNFIIIFTHHWHRWTLFRNTGQSLCINLITLTGSMLHVLSMTICQLDIDLVNSCVQSVYFLSQCNISFVFITCYNYTLLYNDWYSIRKMNWNLEYMYKFPLIHNISCMIIALRIVFVMRTKKWWMIFVAEFIQYYNIILYI